VKPDLRIDENFPKHVARDTLPYNYRYMPFSPKVHHEKEIKRERAKAQDAQARGQSPQHQSSSSRPKLPVTSHAQSSLEKRIQTLQPARQIMKNYAKRFQKAQAATNNRFHKDRSVNKYSQSVQSIP
jgi:hypothetical protein